MAIITKLRDSKVVVLIVVVALVLFVVGDIITNINKASGSDDTVGILAGKKVRYNEFNELVNQREELMRKLANKQEFTEEERQQFNEKAWQILYNDIVLSEEYRRAGIMLGQKEEEDLFVGNTPHQMIAQDRSFADESGNFSPMAVRNFLKAAKTNALYRMYWEEIKREVFTDVLQRKYTTLAQKGIYFTDLELEDEIMRSNSTWAGKIIQLPVSSVADNEIKITDADLQDYLNENKEEYKQEEGRDFEYVLWEINPSVQDTAEVRNWATETILELQNVKDDTLYFESNSDNGFNRSYRSRGSFGAEADYEDALFAAPTGTVVGPFEKNGTVTIFKKIAEKEDTIISYRVSHILIPINSGDSLKAKIEAEALLTQARTGDFAKLAKEKSQDPGSAEKGGDIGWFNASSPIVPEFPNFCKNAKVGQIGLVKSQFGYHIIKMTYAPSSKAIQVGDVSRSIVPGPETLKAADQQISSFRSGLKDNDPSSFEKQAEKFRLTPRNMKDFRPQSREIPGLPGSREVVSWMFDKERKNGDISTVYQTIGNRRVVVHITAVKNEGYAKVEDVKSKLEAEVKQQKKMDKLAEKAEKALEGATNIEGVASKLQTAVQTFEGLNAGGDYIQNIGSEPKVVGVISGIKTNIISKPVRGNAGVYIVTVSKVNKTEAPKNFDSQRYIKDITSGNQTSGPILDAINKLAKVKDLRYKF